MRAGGGREKGFAYERAIALRLGEWWCGDSKALWRNTNSGARATIVGHVYGGDIIPVNASAGKWPLCVEVKKSESWTFDSFILGNPGNELLAFMLQCLYAAELGCNKIPLLICAKNRKPPVAMLHRSAHTMKIIARVRPTILCRLFWPYKLSVKLQKKYPISVPICFYVMGFADFLSSFTRKDFADAHHDRA
jgi:hypothetical protein